MHDTVTIRKGAEYNAKEVHQFDPSFQSEDIFLFGNQNDEAEDIGPLTEYTDEVEPPEYHKTDFLTLRISLVVGILSIVIASVLIMVCVGGN